MKCVNPENVLIEIKGFIRDTVVKRDSGIWVPSSSMKEFDDSLRGFEQEYEKDAIIQDEQESYLELRAEERVVPRPWEKGQLVHLYFKAVESAKKNGAIIEEDGKVYAVVSFRDIICMIGDDGMPKAVGNTVILEPIDAQVKTSGGLHIPETARNRPNKGRLVSAGNDPDGSFTGKEGRVFMFKKNTEYHILRGGKEWFQVDMDYIFAEVPDDELS